MAAGCGGGTATAPDTGGGSPLTIATAAQTATTRPEQPFPAKTAAQVIQLASLRPPGVVRYRVTATTETGDVTYDLEMASNGQRARLHQMQASGEVWVGLNVSTGAVTYLCTAQPTQGPACTAGDPDGLGLETATAIARVFGNDVLQATFGAVAAAPGTAVATDTQAGAVVSCLASSGPGGDVRLCANAGGQITELTAAGTKAIAIAVRPDAAPADLDPPVTG